MGKVMAVCISKKRGTQKENITDWVFIENFGIENDAHAGDWHRQVSLLSYERVEEFRAKGADVSDGAFGEKILKLAQKVDGSGSMKCTTKVGLDSNF